MRKYIVILSEFKIPFLVLLGTVAHLLLLYFKLPLLANVIILAAVFLGTYDMIIDTVKQLLRRHFALDYIALVAIIVSLITDEYVVAGILALMISGGRNLEEYGAKQAKNSLSKLAERIPNEVILWENNAPGRKEKIKKIAIGSEILIRKGEVVPLDGFLQSSKALLDESSLTGEPYLLEKEEGDLIRSGTVNTGDAIVIKVNRKDEDSTYHKILQMVEKAQNEKSPIIRLADSYSTVFTIITFAISAFAYFYSHYDLTKLLAVLTIATPCPLIIATPIALLGGVNAAARRRIIIKKLASLELLPKVTHIIFDKTGTITLGKPVVVNFEKHDSQKSEKEILAIASAIERSSLHPLAKAVVAFAKEKNAPIFHATEIKEELGKGISGSINNTVYTLQSKRSLTGMSIELVSNKKVIASFMFEDELKKESKGIIKRLSELGLLLSIFTGDKKEAAEKIAQQLDGKVDIKAECTPEDKKKGIEDLKKQGKVTAMIGDGINDAPALAFADVGLVFSNEEQTAATDAADIVFLGGDFTQVLTAFSIAQRTIRIAKQSIVWGIGISIVGMIFASLGYIPPLFGAALQEAIDVAVILNALRASR